MNKMFFALLLLLLIGCDSHGEYTPPEQMKYASRCTDKLWSDPELASFNGVHRLTHRELYNECKRDFKRRSLVLASR